MVRPPARSPYETSTNRRDARVVGAPRPQGRRACGRRRPAAISAGFVRLATGRERDRPAGARAALREQAPRGAAPPCRPRAGPKMVTDSVLGRVRRRKRTKNGRRTSSHPSLNGISDQKDAPAGKSAPLRPGRPWLRVAEIAFRARFLRFVARARARFALFGPSSPASNYDLYAHLCSDLRFLRCTLLERHPPRAAEVPFAATNLKKCARNRPAPTRLQRTSKNVQPDAPQPGLRPRGLRPDAPACPRADREPADARRSN